MNWLFLAQTRVKKNLEDRTFRDTAGLDGQKWAWASFYHFLKLMP